MAFLDVEGSQREEPSLLCWTVPFERVQPVRKFGSFRGKRSISGLSWSCTIADHVGSESWLERDRVMALDFDPMVVGLSSQPFRLSWQVNGRHDRIRPTTSSGCAMVLEWCGTSGRTGDIDPVDAAAFAATAQACESVGWDFRRVGALDPARTANLRWLAGYRHPRCLHAGRAADL